MACEEDRLSTAYILLDMGNADPTSLNNEEKTPFQMASDSLQMKLRSRKSRRYAWIYILSFSKGLYLWNNLFIFNSTCIIKDSYFITISFQNMLE